MQSLSRRGAPARRINKQALQALIHIMLFSAPLCLCELPLESNCSLFYFVSLVIAVFPIYLIKSLLANPPPNPTHPYPPTPTPSQEGNQEGNLGGGRRGGGCKSTTVCQPPADNVAACCGLDWSTSYRSGAREPRS